MAVIEGAFRHAALARFAPVQSLSSEGGGPEIVLARTNRGTLVVVKVLLDRPVPADVASALSKETSLGARLTHEAIVQTRAIVIEDEVAALVTEFVPGVSLQRLLRFATQRGVRLPDTAAWYVVERVLSALAFAHSQKEQGAPAPILHRAVSPSSVVVGWDGTVKLGDFGWTRIKSTIAGLGHVGISDHASSTVLMAPEQARGAAVTERADVFCSALLALRVATGRTPYSRFRDTATGVLLAMSEGKVLPLSKTRPELPAGVREAFDRALAIDPEARTVTAQDLADAVRVGFDLAAGKESLVKLLERWREQLEKSMTPWEKRASMHDDAVPTADLLEGALALATADDRPSSDALVSAAEQPDEPWKKDQLPTAEMPLAPTDAGSSLSRVGAAASAESAMSIPLPAMRMTMPSVPVYGPPVGPPPPKMDKPFFTGRVAAAIMFSVFVLLVVGAVYLLRWLSGPS